MTEDARLIETLQELKPKVPEFVAVLPLCLLETLSYRQHTKFIRKLSAH